MRGCHSAPPRFAAAAPCSAPDPEHWYALQPPLRGTPFLASTELEFSFKCRPQADTGLQPTIIEQEGCARDSVCADDTPVAIDGQQPSALCSRGVIATIHLWLLSLDKNDVLW